MARGFYYYHNPSLAPSVGRTLASTLWAAAPTGYDVARRAWGVPLTVAAGYAANGIRSGIKYGYNAVTGGLKKRPVTPRVPKFKGHIAQNVVSTSNRVVPHRRVSHRKVRTRVKNVRPLRGRSSRGVRRAPNRRARSIARRRKLR